MNICPHEHYDTCPPPVISPPPCNSPLKILRAKGAEADLHCDTMVQFCGAIPPPPRGGTITS